MEYSLQQTKDNYFTNDLQLYNSIKIISIGADNYVKEHNIDIEQTQTLTNSTSTKSVIIVKQQSNCRIISISMNSDTLTLFIANNKGDITHYQQDEHSLQYYSVRTLQGHTNQINSISLSNSKMYLLSASCDRTLFVWDVSNGSQIICLNKERKEHKSIILRNCWNCDDSLFASGDMDSEIVIWAPPLTRFNKTEQFLPKYKVNEGMFFNCLKFTDNGLSLFASYGSGSSGKISLWNFNENMLLNQVSNSMESLQKKPTYRFIQQLKGKSQLFTGLIESFDVRGNMLFVSVHKNILILNAYTLETVINAPTFAQVHSKSITSVVININGKYVASGSSDKSIAIFDANNGKCIKHIENVHTNWVQSVAFKN